MINRYTIMRYGPTIGTIAACIGVVATGILSARAYKKYKEACEYPCDKRVEAVKAAIPPVIAGAATIGAFVLVRRADNKAIAALSASTAILSKQLADTNNAVRDIYGQEGYEKVCDQVHNHYDPDDAIILEDGENTNLYYEPNTELYFRASNETVRSAFERLNRNYQLRGGLASLYEWLRFLGIKKRDIKRKGLEWTEYIGFITEVLDADGMCWIDDAQSKDYVDGRDVIHIDWMAPLYPICIDPPVKVHEICHTDADDVEDLYLGSRDDVSEQIRQEIQDDQIE